LEFSFKSGISLKEEIIVFANLKLKENAHENFILEEMNRDILIRRGCNRCPWEKTLSPSTKWRQIIGATPKTFQTL